MEFFVEPEHWDFDNNRPKETRPDKEMLESLISNKINEVRSKIVELKAGYKDFSATSLIEKIKHKTQPVTVGELFRKEINSLREEKRTGYALSVEQVYNSLVKFNKHLDLYFSETDWFTFPPLLVSAYRYLSVPVSTCRYPSVPSITCQYPSVPVTAATTLHYLPVPAFVGAYAFEQATGF